MEWLMHHSAMVETILNETDITDEEKARRIKMRKNAAINAFYENGENFGLKCFSRDYMNNPAEMEKLVEDYWGLK